MNSKYKYLLKMQLYSYFGINRLLHSRDKREKKRAVMVVILALAAVALLELYIIKFSGSMAKAGLGKALPSLMIVICYSVTLTLTFLKSTGALIGLKDYDAVMSMPVTSLAIVASRMTALYFGNIIMSFTAMLPSGIVYCLYVHPPVYGYLFLTGAVFLTPIIPMIISLSIGTVITAVSSRSRRRNVISLVFSTFVVLLAVLASGKARSLDTEQITDLGLAIAEMANEFYPPAKLVANALLHGSFLSFALFAGISLLVGAVFVAVVSRFYKSLNTAVFSHHAKKDYKIGAFKESSPFMALYKKEFLRLSSCTIYALNSCIGMVLLLVAALMAAFFMPSVLLRQMEESGNMDMLQNILPVILAVFVSMTSTTSASLSLEGKSRWIMCSVPVRAKTVFDAKIGANLTVILPILYVSVILLKTAFACSISQTLLMFVVPTVYAFFISVLGIYLNLKFPKYDWPSEYYAVKGGAISVLAAVGGGMAGSLLPLYLCILFSRYQGMIMLCMTLFLLLVTLSVYSKLCRTRLYV